MTPTFCCGAECGVDGSHFSGSGTRSISTSVFYPAGGLRAFRTNPSSATGLFNAGVFTTQTIGVWRQRIYIASAPGADRGVAGFLDSSEVNQIGLMYKSSDGKFYAGYDISGTVSFGSSGVTLATNTWHLLDIKADVHANPWTVDVQVNGVALGQATRAVAANTMSKFRLGSEVASQTFDIYHDDMVCSQTSGDYPIGAGKVLSFVPNADGTHTFTTTNAQKGTTGAPTGGGNITSATTDAFNWVNARPIGGGATDNTRLWNQAANSTTQYAEVLFEDTVEVNPPRAVEALIIRRDAGTGTGDSTFKLNDNGTESTIFATGAVAGIASDDYHTKQFATAPSTGGAWTLALFNGLRFRFGYSADANPDHYCRGVMIEAEFPESLPAGMYGEPDGPVGQGQMQQLLSQ